MLADINFGFLSEESIESIHKYLTKFVNVNFIYITKRLLILNPKKNIILYFINWSKGNRSNISLIFFKSVTQ